MHRAALATFLLCATVWPAAHAASDREVQLKAGYLLNFAKFVEWPAVASDTPITFCFLGGNSIHDALAIGQDKRNVGNRPLALRSLTTWDQAAGCDVLYVDGIPAQENRPPAQMHVLTVSDAASFTQRGGIIHLFTDSNRLRFSINVDNAKRAGLNVSSGLLQLAASVERERAR